MIRRVADTKTNVLVIGESGTGKELVARLIHDSSALRGRPFIPVNCGAIPETLIESEMFGHKRGSFTGAVSEKAGLFEAATGGTLFLDEVGELPLTMQVKLLRAIQERVIRKVGGNDDIHVDVRIIAATNRDLEAAIAKGTFREDLYYRLNVILIKTPPLRERKEDIKGLAEHFLEQFSSRMKRPLQGIEDRAFQALLNYDWPGNVRELENIMERAVTLEPSDTITLDSLPAVFRNRNDNRQTSASQTEGNNQPSFDNSDIVIKSPDFNKGPANLDEILANVEKTLLLRALQHAGGVKRKAAILLGITFRSIRYRLSKLGVQSDED